MIKEMLPLLLAEMGFDPNAPLPEQSQLTVQIERLLAAWFAQKKLRCDVPGRMVLMFDLDDQTGKLRMIPVIMDYPGNWDVSPQELGTVTDAAFRSLAQTADSPERAQRIREVHDHAKRVVNLATSGNLIGSFMVDQGINVTYMAQCIPMARMIVPLMDAMQGQPNPADVARMTDDEKAKYLAEAEAKGQQLADELLGHLAQAARWPGSRLVPQGTPKLTNDTAQPAATPAPVAEVPDVDALGATDAEADDAVDHGSPTALQVVRDEDDDSAIPTTLTTSTTETDDVDGEPQIYTGPAPIGNAEH